MKKIKIITIHKEIGEKDPEKAYKEVCGPNTYLLESCEGGEKVARYSFIGFNPAAKLTITAETAVFEAFEPSLKGIDASGNDPIQTLRGIMDKFTLKAPYKGLSRFFGGFVGYISYDMVRFFVKLPNTALNDLNQPVCELLLAKNNMIFDHKKQKTYLVSHEFLSEGEVVNNKKAYKGLDVLEKALLDHVPKRSDKLCQHNPSTFSSNITKAKFEEKVRAAKEYIYSGDIFQVVLSQRLETEYSGDVFSVYKALKKINPSPYMYCLDFGGRKVVGASPEMLARVEGRRVETYPIAGTRPRGKSEKEDILLEKEMLSDEKERAEHVMLVDLGRNDAGKVALFGSVKVTKFMEVEKYSHVQHMVSEVTGELKPENDEFDALKAIFPAGTVSGAPKVRAMEIIEELEPTRRGVYAGAVGYFSFNHNMDTAISIRTITFEKDRAYIQAGAGIVADSKPEAEYEESLNKAQALFKALKEAE